LHRAGTSFPPAEGGAPCAFAEIAAHLRAQFDFGGTSDAEPPMRHVCVVGGGTAG